jgi:octaprenyl-diphosphate synthase
MAQTLDTNQMTEFAEPVRADLEVFSSRLNDYLQGDSPLITSIARHLLKSRGKRIRPVFLFLSSRAANNFTDYSVDASLAIELIHTATLLHDDVVDESDLRRGIPTVNAKWTNLISVLMGDYLFAKAFRIMVRAGSIDLMEAVSRATERVSIGELRQIEETGNYDLSEGEYLSIIADKTASLFNVSCESGPILNKRSGKERDAFARFGEDIGTAFQIADDLLDFVGDAETTGKQPGNDVLTGKVTLPLIFALQKTGKAAKSEIISCLEKGVGRPEVFEQIHYFVQENGGIDYAYRRADELSQRGMDAIGEIEPSVYFESLANLVRFTTSRVA